MFRNFVLPALAIALIALVVHNPAFAHDTLHKRIIAMAAIVGPALLIRLVIAARRPQKPAAARQATPYAAPARRR